MSFPHKEHNQMKTGLDLRNTCRVTVLAFRHGPARPGMGGTEGMGAQGPLA